MFKMSFLDEGFHRYKSLCIWDLLKHKNNYKTPILGVIITIIGITKPRIINSFFFFHFNLNCILSYYYIDILEIWQVPGVRHKCALLAKAKRQYLERTFGIGNEFS